MLHQRLLEHLHARLPAALDVLRRMVEINSFTANAAGVDAVAALTADVFAPLGLLAERQPADNPAFAAHLFLSRPGRSGRHVALVAHLDTVFPPEEEVAQDFRWRRHGGRVHGPGVADIKGGTVVAWLVLDALRAVCPEVFGHFHWTVALDAREEQMSGDFAAGLRRRLPADRTAAILVLECGTNSGKDRLVVARKGMANFRVTVSGKAAHAGTGFWHGRNAVVEAAALVPRLAGLADRRRDLTVNVGAIRGGTVTNRVPHECVIEGELRAFDPEVLAGCKAALAEVVAGCASARLEFSGELPPWPDNPGSRALLAAWRQAGEALGLRLEPEFRAGLSDGNLLWSHAPTLDGLGPVGGNCHCSQRGPDGGGQEYAVEESFVTKAALTAAALVGLGGTNLPGGAR
jgi:glutamate carboxypeptidase